MATRSTVISLQAPPPLAMICALVIFNTETAACNGFQLVCLPLTEMSIAGVPEYLRQLGEMCVGKLLRCGILLQNGNRGFTEDRVKLCFKFRKHPVEESDDLPLKVAGQINEIVSVPAQLLQCQQLVLGDVTGRVSSKTDELSDDEGVPGIRLGLANEHLPHGGSLDGVENDYGISILPQTGI